MVIDAVGIAIRPGSAVYSVWWKNPEPFDARLNGPGTSMRWRETAEGPNGPVSPVVPCGPVAPLGPTLRDPARQIARHQRPVAAPCRR